MPIRCHKSEYPMDSIWSWVTCVWCTLSFALAVGFSYSFGVLLPVLMKYFNSSTGHTAWLGSLTMAFTFFFGPISGLVCQRFTCRKTLSAGGLLCFISLLSSSFVNSFPLLFFTYCFLFGLGSSFIFTSSVIAVPLNFERNVALATGLVSAGQGIGILSFGPLLQLLLNRFSWHVTFRISSGLIFIICVVGVFTGTSNHGRVSRGTRKSTSRRCEQHLIVRPTRVDRPFWKNFFFVIMTVGSSVEFFAQYVPQVHIIRYCNSIGISKLDASSMFIFFGITSSLSRIGAGLLCKLRKVNPRLLCQVAGYGTALSILALPFARTLTLLQTSFFFYGLFDGLFITTSNYTRLNCLSPKQRAVAFGLSVGCTAVFGAIGPPIAGEMADAFSSYNPPFFMSAAVVCLGATIPFLQHCVSSSSESSEQTLLSSEEDDTLVVEYLTVL